MLSQLDNIIFPDRCDVIEIIPSQRYFYSIFKNASSSIDSQVKRSKLRIYFNERIKTIPNVDVIIRSPADRFASGVNSFVTLTLNSNPTLDKDTVFWFATNYLHLNRHYCMQFSWLVNLARYLAPDAKINLFGMEYINQITEFKDDPWGTKEEKFSETLKNLPGQEMYNRIDQVLFDAIGQSLTFGEIVELIQTQDYEAYKHVILKAQKILAPTYVVPKT